MRGLRAAHGREAAAAERERRAAGGDGGEGTRVPGLPRPFQPPSRSPRARSPSMPNLQFSGNILRRNEGSGSVVMERLVRKRETGHEGKVVMQVLEVTTDQGRSHKVCPHCFARPPAAQARDGVSFATGFRSSSA